MAVDRLIPGAFDMYAPLANSPPTFSASSAFRRSAETLHAVVRRRAMCEQGGTASVQHAEPPSVGK